MSSTWPIRYRNQSGSTIPAYGMLRLESGVRVTDAEVVFHGELVDVPSDQALFVNSPLDCADDGYGWCRACVNGPFWVKPEDIAEVAVGDAVGPVDNQTYVSLAGAGYVVLFKDTDKGLIYCDQLGGQVMFYARLSASLSVATAFLDGATTATANLVLPDPNNPGDLVESAVSITVTNRWTTFSAADNTYIVVRRIHNEWAPVQSECPP